MTAVRAVSCQADRVSARFPKWRPVWCRHVPRRWRRAMRAGRTDRPAGPGLLRPGWSPDPMSVPAAQRRHV